MTFRPVVFFGSMKSSHKTLILLLVLAISASLTSLAFGGYLVAAAVASFILLLLWLTKPLWAPDKPRPVISALTVVSVCCISDIGQRAGRKNRSFSGLLLWLHFTPEQAKSVASSDHVLSGGVMVFVLVGVYLANRFTGDRSAMTAHPKRLDTDFPEQTYKRQRSRFVEILLGRLATLDDETKWDDYYFAPLDAEVEVSTSDSSHRVIVDLMTALKTEKRSRLVLVLGDPGAGKSIALRKLAKELLREVESTGRVPVYINLKEWISLRSWDEKTPPTVVELRAFVLSTLKGQNLFVDQFLSGLLRPYVRPR